MNDRLGLDGLAYGGDYNPEQWPEETWAEDVRLMRDAGVNLVTVGVFAWSRLEPASGRWDFDWLDRVLDLLHDHGIRADLATGTASPPPWLVRRHPEILPVDARGTRLEFGSRQTYCPSSPVWRDETIRLARVMAERYGEHPALALWHVSNEFGDELSRCWCPVTAGAFRDWLKRRYGDVDELNRAWGTTVWSQRYRAFEEIEPPRATTGPGHPAHWLDFERFSSDALIRLFRGEAAVLRQVTPDVPVTTNFMGAFRQVDYWALAAAEDIVGDDAYPDPADPGSAADMAFNYSLMRSLKRRPWLLLESATSAVSWRDVNVPKTPGRSRFDALQAIAHGSDGVMRFQWRQSRSGPEQHHSAMVGHRGAASRVYQETVRLGQDLARLAPVRGTRVRSRVAMVVDWESWWAQDVPASMPSRRLRWLDQARRWHAAAASLGHAPDCVQATGPFDGYAVVLIPGLYQATEDQARALAGYAATGGHLLVGPFSGVVDATAAVHPGGPPGPLRDLVGIEVDEPWPLADGQTAALAVGDERWAVEVWQEAVAASPDTDVLGVLAGGPLAGGPALTRRRSGSGLAYYLGAVTDAPGLAAVLRLVLTDAGLDAADLPDGVTRLTRTDGRTDYTFLLNHGDRPRDVVVPVPARDLLTGADVTGRATLGAYGALVLCHPAEGLR
jgi:beta-galactosidase